MEICCESNNHNGVVIFDVGRMQELEELWKKFSKSIEWDSNDKRSLIHVTNLLYFPYKGPREGHWYYVQFGFWDSFELDFETYNSNSDNFNLLFRIGAKYKSKDIKLNFQNHLSDE